MAKQKIIIFEGPEKTGKTNIAKSLSKVLDIPYYKDRWQRQKSPLILQLLDFLAQTKYSVIIDRDYPSYYVYYKYYDLEVSPDFYVADKLASDLEAKIIICFKTKYLNYNDEVSLEANKKLLDLYHDFVKEIKCQSYFLDTTSEDLGNEIKQILKWMAPFLSKNENIVYSSTIGL